MHFNSSAAGLLALALIAAIGSLIILSLKVERQLPHSQQPSH
jgi:hypothetical protein